MTNLNGKFEGTRIVNEINEMNEINMFKSVGISQMFLWLF